MKAVLLDLDDTLYEYEPCHEAGLKFLAESVAKIANISNEEAISIYNKVRKSINEELVGTASSHNRLLYSQRLCEALKINSVYYARKFENLYWEAYFQKMFLREGIISFFDRLLESSIQIVIVTDLVAEIQFRKLDFLNIGHYVNYVVTSEEAGAEKPDPKIFLLALRKIGKNPEDVIMIGDNFKKDYLGATSLGIKSFLFSKSIDSEYNSFCSFPELTKQLFR